MYYTLYAMDGSFHGRIEVRSGEPNPRWAPYIVIGKHPSNSRYENGEVVETDYDEMRKPDRLIAFRRDRKKLLDDSDWTQTPDNGLSNEEKNAWRVYRQALRDMTTDIDLANIQWPTQP